MANAGLKRIVLAIGLLACVALVLFSPAARGQSPGSEADEDPSGVPYATGELVVTHEPGLSQAEISSLGNSRGAERKGAIPETNAVLFSFPAIKNESSSEGREKALERIKQALKRDPAVETVDFNYRVSASYTPNDSGFDNQWGLKRIKAPDAWNKSEGNGVDIAVLDTGIDTDHPDLQAKIADQRNFVAYPETNDAEDGDGHGTHVSGIAAAVTDYGKGVAGTCPDCRLLVGKVLDDDGGGYSFDVADGITWATDNGAEVINLSLGGSGESDVLKNAGNDGETTKHYPAAYPNAMAVVATNKNDDRASFSNYGGWVDVAAPGTGILSTYLGGKYAKLSGTSMSTPYVAGLAGLLAAQERSAPQVRGIIESTTVDLRPLGKDSQVGWGRINAKGATSCEIVGTPGSETLEGTGGDDVICGLGGSDTIPSRAGNDVVRAGPGADVIKGGGGRDILIGWTGTDRMRGNGGRDRLNGKDGARGNDYLNGGRDNDSCRADRKDTKRSC